MRAHERGGASSGACDVRLTFCNGATDASVDELTPFELLSAAELAMSLPPEAEPEAADVE